MPCRGLLYFGVSLFTPCPLCGVYGLPWVYIQELYIMGLYYILVLFIMILCCGLVSLRLSVMIFVLWYGII
nr:MAG TPA: restriction alleviation protein [Caudoviricetes sp.]